MWRERLHIFVEKPYWKTHRIVDVELDKLEIALDVNDNYKSEFRDQMKRMKR